MTRFKKELKKLGWEFDEDFPWMPYQYPDSNIVLEESKCIAAEAAVVVVHNVAAAKVFFNRQLKPAYSVDLD